MDTTLNSFDSLVTLEVSGKKYRHHSLQAFAKSTRIDLSRIPLFLENTSGKPSAPGRRGDRP